MAKARLKAAEDSVAFSERELILANGPIKVGRSVGELKPAPHNAFFHCKVLSRNHALVWYDTAQRRFFVKDTKSSNGTFVNKQKIGPREDSSDCAPFEIFSGDVIQFGVEVQEATKKDNVTVTHGCIITHVKLINPDGTEYLPPASALDQQHLQSVIATQDLYILNKYLKEAKEREVEVEKKLNSFLDVIQQLEKQSENGCDNVIREDYLLSKIEILEAQVNALNEVGAEPATLPVSSLSGFGRQGVRDADAETLYAQDDDNNIGNQRDDDAVTIAGQFDAELQEKLANSVVDVRRIKLDELDNIKALYEQGAKEYLNRAMMEKISVLDHVAQVENELGKCQSECEYLKNNCLSVEAALKDLVQRHQDQLERTTQLLTELKDAEQSKQQLQTDAERDKRDLELRIDDANAKAANLSARVSEAVAESTLLKDQVEGLEAMRRELLDELEQYRGREYCDEGVQTELTMTDDLYQQHSGVEETIDSDSASLHSYLADESRIAGSSATPSLLDRLTGLIAGSDADLSASSAANTNDTFDKPLNSKNADVRETNTPSPRNNFTHLQRSITPSRSSDRDVSVVFSSGRKSADSSRGVREQQSVEQFLASVSDSDVADRDTDTTSATYRRPRFSGDNYASERYEEKPLSPKKPTRVVDANNASPVLSPSRGGLYQRQETLTEVRCASTAVTDLEDRLRKIENCVAGYSGDAASSSQKLMQEHRSGLPHAVEMLVAASAIAIMLFTWLLFDS